MELGYPQRFSVFNRGIVVLAVVTLIALMTVKLIGMIDLSGGYFGYADASEIAYTKYGDAEDRTAWLNAGVKLADDLQSGNASSDRRDSILKRLDKIRETIRRGDLDQAEQDKWLKIDTAVRLQHIQQAQVADILKKKCSGISAAAISPEGQVWESPVEITC